MLEHEPYRCSWKSSPTKSSVTPRWRRRLCCCGPRRGRRRRPQFAKRRAPSKHAGRLGRGRGRQARQAHFGALCCKGGAAHKGALPKEAGEQAWVGLRLAFGRLAETAHLLQHVSHRIRRRGRYVRRAARLLLRRRFCAATYRTRSGGHEWRLCSTHSLHAPSAGPRPAQPWVGAPRHLRMRPSRYTAVSRHAPICASFSGSPFTSSPS
jgi:hypothetical protein